MGLMVDKTWGVTVVHHGGDRRGDLASRRNPDGTSSLLTTLPGLSGLEFVVGERVGKRTLTTRDNQHEYVFLEADG